MSSALMRRRSLIFGALFLGVAPGMARASKQLAAALENAGYLSDLDDRTRPVIQQAIAREGFAGALSHPKRLAFADIEDLAEGGVGQWMHEQIRPLLAARNIHVPDVQDQFPVSATDPYSVVISGQVRIIWRVDDETAQAVATTAAFEIVNDILERSPVSDRLHFLDNGGGNDGQAWLLTPEQAQIIRDLGGVDRRWWPFIPTRLSPWYGQYH
ncbi:MAG: hypothetical protein WAU68_13500 [Vitreimonas sp.]